MICKNCFNVIDDGSKFCHHCGAQQDAEPQQQNQTYQQPQYQQPQYQQPQYQEVQPENKSNGFAIAGFVLSFFMPILGWIFGGIGLKNSKNLHKGKGLSIAAIVIASVMFVLNLISMMA